MTDHKKTKEDEVKSEEPASSDDSEKYPAPFGVTWKTNLYSPHFKLTPDQFVTLTASTAPLSGVHFASQPRILTTQEQHLTHQIGELRNEVNTLIHSLKDEKEQSEKWKQHNQDIEDKLKDLEAKERLRFILDRIAEEPRKLLVESKTFQQKFLDESLCTAYVMSVDIRRSTDLMLKARKPQFYASFITELCTQLQKIILGNHAVYDKFTGDGILVSTYINKRTYV